MKESTESEEEESFLRETVFERLNTGGVKLERQEIRNALHRSLFNDLLDEISRWDEFRDVWGLPRWVENEIDTNPKLLDNPLFSKMGDAEIILRFFALRHVTHYRNGMQGFLDIYMRKASRFFTPDIDFLRDLYRRTFSLAHDIYNDLVFRPYNSESGKWDNKPHKAFYDAVMVALSERIGEADELRHRSSEIIDATKTLFAVNEEGTFTGRGNTKQDILGRIGFYREMLSKILGH